MSAKYQRIKQQDLLLPAPLRWLTRAFSSITLAVILLACVALYGTLASVPVAFLAKGLIYGFTSVGTLGLAMILAYLLWQQPKKYMGLAALLVLIFGLGANALAWLAAHHWITTHPWFTLHKATIIYRLHWFDMTELEFYNRWPMKLILGLFIVNMIWATIRRIEFRFVNLGVLTVHTGIVLMGLGTLFYAQAKIEGDTILFRRDLGGQPIDRFYDKTTPALYFLTPAPGSQPVLMAELPGLPRYNDYLSGQPRPLNITLHQDPAFVQLFGSNLRVTIREFIAYGELQNIWVDGRVHGSLTSDAPPNPALRLELGDRDKTQGLMVAMLLANVPAQRIIDMPSFGIEFLYQPPQDRIDDLMVEFDGSHGLVVEIPAQNYRRVLAIAPGQTVELDDTGYTLNITDIGPYDLRFVTPGYQGASDTRAMVQVTHGQRIFTRMAMHRYPERSQDFTPAPDNPNAGPMGLRSDPDPSIQLTYIDASKPQFRLLAADDDLSKLELMVRLPGMKPFRGQFPDDRFPLGRMEGKERWVHVVQKLSHAMQSTQPRITPRSQRNPKDEGTLINALLPVDLETTIISADGQTQPWSRRVWLTHMRYPMFPDEYHKPVTVDIPGVGNVQLAFSRLSLPLPFAMQLERFEMQPYPGTQIPRDFVANLSILDLQGDADRQVVRTVEGEARLNNPLHHQGIKLSQTGWDPGDSEDPMRWNRDNEGRFTNQQRYTILGIGNNVGIRIIFVGGCMVALGIPWAFYLKPYLMKRAARPRAI